MTLFGRSATAGDLYLLNREAKFALQILGGSNAILGSPNGCHNLVQIRQRLQQPLHYMLPSLRLPQVKPVHKARMKQISTLLCTISRHEQVMLQLMSLNSSDCSCRI